MDLQTGLKLQTLRKEHGLSQEELAHQLNVSRQAVSKWERGEAYPDTDNLILLAKLYKISLDQLVANENNKNTAVLETHKRKLKTDILGLITVITPLLTVSIYLLLGSVWGLWHPSWIIFLNIIIVPSFVMAVKKKKGVIFTYPILVVAGYLCLGFIWGLWHPAWIIFTTIPIYYVAFSFIDKK